MIPRSNFLSEEWQIYIFVQFYIILLPVFQGILIDTLSFIENKWLVIYFVKLIAILATEYKTLHCIWYSDCFHKNNCMILFDL